MSHTSVAGRPVESILGIGYALLIDAKTAGGAYELMKFVVMPGGGPPPHRHRREDEAFYILDGELEVMLGSQARTVRAGDSVHLPRGVPHAFRNASSRPATLLCWVTPGNLAGFFESFKVPWSADAQQPPPPTEADIGRMLAAAQKYDIEIMPPG